MVQRLARAIALPDFDARAPDAPGGRQGHSAGHAVLAIPASTGRLVLAARRGACALPCPSSPADVLTQGRQQRPQELRWDTVHNLAHLGVGGHLGHPKDGFQVAAATALLHCALKLQQTGVLQEQHGKATQERVMQSRVDAIGTPGIGKKAAGF
jgi:hypothetical protein